MNDNNNNYNVPPAPAPAPHQPQPQPAPVATPPAKPANIFEKLCFIQQNLKAPKNQKSTYYTYRSCEDILEAVKPLLKQTKTVLTLSDEMKNIGNDNYIEVTATLTCVSSKESISNSGTAKENLNSKNMSLAQMSGAISSYARKYTLNGLFAIDDAKDDDSMSSYNTPKPVQNNNQQQNQGYNNQQPQQQNNQGPSPYDFQNQQNNNQQYQTKPQPQGSIPWGQLQDGQRTNCPKCGQSAFVNNKVSAKTGKMYWNINCTSCGTKTWRPS